MNKEIIKVDLFQYVPEHMKEQFKEGWGRKIFGCFYDDYVAYMEEVENR